MRPVARSILLSRSSSAETDQGQSRSDAGKVHVVVSRDDLRTTCRNTEVICRCRSSICWDEHIALQTPHLHAFLHSDQIIRSPADFAITYQTRYCRLKRRDCRIPSRLCKIQTFLNHITPADMQHGGLWEFMFSPGVNEFHLASQP